MAQKKGIKDILIMGFALFAMFFGAGNLIFPPLLGFNAGSNWVIAFLCFISTAVGLSVLALMVIAKHPDGSIGVVGVLGKVPANLLLIMTALCIGPFIAVPRTAATTYELAVQPIFPQVSSWTSAIIFFIISALLCIKPSKVMDIVGSILSPLLVIALAVLIGKGVISPIGEIAVGSSIDGIMKEGILSGYQTMDMLGSVLFSVAVLSNFTARGYVETKERFRAVGFAGLIAATGLFFVYGGLAYMGATTSSTYPIGLSQAELLIAINKDLLGNLGVVLLGVIVASACLTTSIGITTSCASYFVDLTKGKLQYTHLVVVISLFSCVVSNFGISQIVALASPALEIIYPIFVVVMFLSLFSSLITNVNIYRGAAFFTCITSVLSVVESLTPLTFEVHRLPLDAYGFNWLVPAIIGGVIGGLIKGKNRI